MKKKIFSMDDFIPHCHRKLLAGEKLNDFEHQVMFDFLFIELVKCYVEDFNERHKGDKK